MTARRCSARPCRRACEPGVEFCSEHRPKAPVGSLALEHMMTLCRNAWTDSDAAADRAALADLRALMAQSDRREAECVRLLAEARGLYDRAKAAEAENARLRAALDGLLFAPNSDAARAAAREAREGVKP